MIRLDKVVFRLLNIVSKPQNRYIVALSQYIKAYKIRERCNLLPRVSATFLKLSRQTNGKYVSQKLLYCFIMWKYLITVHSCHQTKNNKSLQDKGTAKSVTAGKQNFLKVLRRKNGKYVPR